MTKITNVQTSLLTSPGTNDPWTWRVLSEAQIKQIRIAALTHIERHGFSVQHEGLLARAASGAPKWTKLRAESACPAR